MFWRVVADWVEFLQARTHSWCFSSSVECSEVETQTQMISAKAREHKTWWNFSVLWTKATILLHYLIKFINWIKCLLSVQSGFYFISEEMLGDVMGVMCLGVRWWKNRKNRNVYGMFCCSTVLPYGFYSCLALWVWWRRYSLQSVSDSGNLNFQHITSHTSSQDQAKGYWKFHSITLHQITQFLFFFFYSISEKYYWHNKTLWLYDNKNWKPSVCRSSWPSTDVANWIVSPIAHNYSD